MATVIERRAEDAPETEPSPVPRPEARDGGGSEDGRVCRLPCAASRCLLYRPAADRADAFWIIHAERVGYGPFYDYLLFANVLFLLTVLLALNIGLRRFAPRLSLSQAELLLIYTMLAVGAALAGQDMGSALLPMLTHLPVQHLRERLAGSLRRVSAPAFDGLRPQSAGGLLSGTYDAVPARTPGGVGGAGRAVDDLHRRAVRDDDVFERSCERAGRIVSDCRSRLSRFPFR